MKNRLTRFRALLMEEDAATIVEYAVMLALVVIVCMGVITVLGGKVNTIFTAVDQGVPGGS